MIELLTTISANPWLVVLLSALGLILLCAVGYIVISQGREFNLGSIHIGSRDSQEQIKGEAEVPTDKDTLYVRYVKVTSFGNPKSSPPVLTKPIIRNATSVEVVNESIWFDVVLLSGQEPLPEWEFRSGGIAEGRSLIPWLPPATDLNQYDPMSLFKQRIDVSGRVFSAVFHSYNGFRPGRSDIGIRPPIDVDEVRLIVDFTSIKGFRSLLRATPEVIVQRGDSREIGAAVEESPGIFCATKKTVKKGHAVMIDFDIDWSEHEAGSNED